VVGRAEIAEHVWDESFDPFSNLIEVYVNRVRRKIDVQGAKPLLHTRRGAGYFFGVVAEGAVESREAESAPHGRARGNTPGRKSHA
jgi:DNA-binding winged helix-turn-helix (wHTH) protein